MVNKKQIMCGILIGLIATFSSISAVVLADKNGSTSQDTAIALNNVKQSSDGKPEFENNRYKMLLEEETLGVVIEDKETGFQYETTKLDETSNSSWKGFMNTGVTVEFYSKRSTMPERVDLEKGNPKKTFTYYKDGFDVILDFESYEFSMCLEVRVTQDGMTAKVKKDSIVEGESYFLGSIYLYPMLGATKLGEEKGYMFIPEGAGALIDLADNHGKFKTPYTKRIYGSNIGVDKYDFSSYGKPSVKEPEDISVPVFGMVYTDKKQGVLGIIEDGQYNAEIIAYPNGVTTEYNWITAKFNYRDIYTMQTASDSGVPTYEKTPYLRDIGIRYQFVAKDEASYTGLAKTYQAYLLEQGILKKQDDKFEVKLDFFGADSKKWFIFNTVVPMTTVDQMNDIMDDLLKNDVKDILPIYKGWQSMGISLNYGSGKFKLEGKLGSQKKLLALIEKLREKDITLVLEQDILKANPSRFYNSSKDIVKGINQVIAEETTKAWIFPTMYYLTPMKSLEFAKRFMEQYSDTSVKDVALSGIPNTLFSYYSHGETYSRGDTVSKVQEIMEVFDTVDLSLVEPYEYLWQYTNKYFDMSLSTSNYTYLSEEIPFIPLVLKGYIPYWASYNNFEANEEEFFLKMIEYGAYPSFLITEKSPIKLRNTNSSYIYTSEYDVLKDEIMKYYNEMGDALRLVEGVQILSHERIKEEIVSVVYENGVQFAINYSDENYKFGNITVPSMSYAVIEKR